MRHEQLQAVVWVARLKGFAAAASKLNSTQPAISNRIRSLENELGVTLFERSTRSVHLTREGSICVEIAEQILEMADRLREEIGARDSLIGTVKIGVSESIAVTWLPALMAHLQEQYPRLRLDLEVGPTWSLLDVLRESGCDLLLVGGTSRNISPNFFSAEYLGSLQFCWMMSGKDQLPALPITPAYLQTRRVFSYSRKAFIHAVVDDWFRKGGAPPQQYSSCDSMWTLASLTMAGLGVGLLPPTLFSMELENGDLQLLTATPELPALDFYAIHVPDRSSLITRVVVSAAKEMCDFPNHPAPV